MGTLIAPTAGYFMVLLILVIGILGFAAYTLVKKI